MSPLQSVICSGSVYILEVLDVATIHLYSSSQYMTHTIWLPSSVKLMILSVSLPTYMDNDFQMLDALYQEAIMKQNLRYTYLGLEPLYL